MYRRDLDDIEFNEQEENEGFELGPGDLVLVVKDNGDVETYFGVDESNEEKEETRHLASFLLFALNDEGCRALFESYMGSEKNRAAMN